MNRRALRLPHRLDAPPQDEFASIGVAGWSSAAAMAASSPIRPPGASVATTFSHDARRRGMMIGVRSKRTRSYRKLLSGMIKRSYFVVLRLFRRMSL
jgi:hypothetical protein